MLSNHLVLCCPLLLFPSVFLSIRVFCNKSALHIRWKSFCFSTSPSNEYSKLISFRNGWSTCSPRDSQESSPTPQFKSINSSSAQLSLWSNSHIHTWLLEKPQLWRTKWQTTLVSLLQEHHEHYQKARRTTIWPSSSTPGLPYDPAILLLDIYLKKSKTLI